MLTMTIIIAFINNEVKTALYNISYNEMMLMNNTN